MDWTTCTGSGHSRDRRPGFRRTILVACPLMMAQWGCSSLSGTPGGLTGTFWNPSKKAAEAPGYDSYADNAIAVRPLSGDQARIAARDRGQDGRPPGHTKRDQTTTAVARADAPPADRGREPGDTRRSSDTNVRITLGRPESLPTLKDGMPETGALLASANPKPGSRTSEQRRESADATPQTRGGGRTVAASEETAARPARSRPRSHDREAKLAEILAAANDRLEALATYRVNITRVERINGQLQPEEDVLLNIQRKPKAVRLEWVKGPSKGREVIYSAAVNDRMMYVNMGNPALPISRMSLPVDSPLALRNSRHPITEAGFDTIFDSMRGGSGSKSPDAKTTGALVYKGIERPNGLDVPCHLIERTTDQGETWRVFLDVKTLMPVVVSAQRTRDSELIERYTYREFRPNPVELASADAFNPDKRWGEAKGWLSRLARSAGSAEARQEVTKTR